MKQLILLFTFLICLTARAQPAKFTNSAELTSYLQSIIDSASENSKTEAYFAGLYKQTTLAINAYIAKGSFEDSSFVKSMVCNFGEKFAYAVFHKNNPELLPVAWRIAFNLKNKKHTDLQLLLLAINAHINYDLPETLYDLSGKYELSKMTHDFILINEIFESLTIKCKSQIIIESKYSNNELRLLNKAMVQGVKWGKTCRGLIWKGAIRYNKSRRIKSRRIVRHKNERAFVFSFMIAHPVFRLKRSLSLVKRVESPSVKTNLDFWF